MSIKIVQSRVIRIFCFLLLLLASVMQLMFSIQEQLVFSDKINFLKKNQIRNARILTHIAKRKHLFDARINESEAMLQQALYNNSYYVPAWLSLAELYNDLGKKESVSAVYAYIDFLTKDLKRWRWDKAMVAYQLGREDILEDELQFIISQIPGESRSQALKLAFSLWKNPEVILNNLGSENILHIFRYSIDKRFLNEALYFWKIIEREKNIDSIKKTVLPLIDLLLESERIWEAGTLWRKYFNHENILYNGDFSQKFLQRAFGWRKKSDKGFTLRFEKSNIDEDERTLKFQFKGWGNLNFRHLYQIVPIQGGHFYQLSFDTKSEKLTTDQRPFIEVYGDYCDGLYVKSAMVAQNQDWKNNNTYFVVPEDCDAIVVRLRRMESLRIDNKLTGKMWLKKIELDDLGKNIDILE